MLSLRFDGEILNVLEGVHLASVPYKEGHRRGFARTHVPYLMNGKGREGSVWPDGLKSRTLSVAHSSAVSMVINKAQPAWSCNCVVSTTLVLLSYLL